MQKTVLVTGASTGIGFDAVRALVQAGFQVVATVRKDVDEDRLLQIYSKKVHVIKMDVTDFAAVEKLPEVLEKQFNIKQLYGLVNNAGIALAGPFLHMDFSQVQSTFQVNTMALMKVTQVLLPLLGARPGNYEPGRIVNISSISGTGAAPFLTVYAASKFAVEGFSEGLRRELMLYGIKVIVVGPGSIKTPIWEKGFHAIPQHYAVSEYGESFQAFVAMASAEGQNGLDVERVSEDVVHALTSAEPKLRYTPIPRRLRNWYLPKLLPVRFYDRLTARLLKLTRRTP